MKHTHQRATVKTMKEMTTMMAMVKPMTTATKLKEMMTMMPVAVTPMLAWMRSN